MNRVKRNDGKRAATAPSESVKLRREQAKVFSETMRRYLEALNIEQTQLAEEAGISRQEISMWLGGKKRPPGWLDAGRMAGVIFLRMLRMEKDGGKIPAGLRFDNALLTQEFLNAAGFKMNDGYEDQPLWRRLEDVDKKGRILRVGWFPWGEFARVKNDKYPASAPDNFGGLSEKLCRRLCALLGVAMEPVPIEVHEMMAKLWDGEVDLLAPLIQLPARKFAFACSQRIPGLNVGLTMLVHESLMERSLPSLQQMPMENFQVWLVRGGVADVLLPRGSVGEIIEAGSFDEALDGVKQHCIDPATGRFRAFMADSVSCHHALKHSKPKLSVITHDRFSLPDAFRDQHTLPVAFGVHPNETRFLAVVDSCLEIMADDGPELLNPSPPSLGFIEKTPSPKR